MQGVWAVSGISHVLKAVQKTNPVMNKRITINSRAKWSDHTINADRIS